MTSVLESWPRQYYQQAGGKPLLHYVIFGALPAFPAFSPLQYRSTGLQRAIKLYRYDEDNPARMQEFRSGTLWKKLQRENPALAQAIERAPECIVLKGELEDADNLNYLRDTVGMVTFLLDHGGCAVQDPLIAHWWSPAEWRQKIFAPAGPAPRSHVAVLTAPDTTAGGQLGWVHTRGMRKFGRPDLSIRRVLPEYVPAAVELCTRFLEFLAFGAFFQEGQEIRVKNLAAPLTCHLKGDVNDPDFANTYVEIVFPGG